MTFPNIYRVRIYNRQCAGSFLQTVHSDSPTNAVKCVQEFIKDSDLYVDETKRVRKVGSSQRSATVEE